MLVAKRISSFRQAATLLRQKKGIISSKTPLKISNAQKPSFTPFNPSVGGAEKDLGQNASTLVSIQQQQKMEKERLLFRKIPIALSLMERSMLKRRAQLGSRPLKRTFPSPSSDYSPMDNNDNHKSKNNNHKMDPLFPPALLEDMMRSLHDCEAERRWYLKAEMEQLNATSTKLQRSLREVTIRLRRARQRERAQQQKQQSVGRSSSSHSTAGADLATLQEQKENIQQRIEENESDRRLLLQSLVARPFLSARLWGFLCREDVWVAWMRSASTSTASSSSSSLSSSISLPLVRLLSLWSGLVLGVLHDVLGPHHQPLSTISPRFVVSLPSRSHRRRRRYQLQQQQQQRRGGARNIAGGRPSSVVLDAGSGSSSHFPARTESLPSSSSRAARRQQGQISLQWMPPASQRLLPLLRETLALWRLLLAEINVRSVLQSAPSSTYSPTHAARHPHPAPLLTSLLVTVQEVATTTLLLHHQKQGDSASRKTRVATVRENPSDAMKWTPKGNAEEDGEPEHHRDDNKEEEEDGLLIAERVKTAAENNEKAVPQPQQYDSLAESTPRAGAATTITTTTTTGMNEAEKKNMDVAKEEEEGGEAQWLAMMAMMDNAGHGAPVSPPSLDQITDTCNGSASRHNGSRSSSSSTTNRGSTSSVGEGGSMPRRHPSRGSTETHTLDEGVEEQEAREVEGHPPANTTLHTVLQELQEVLLNQVGEIRQTLHEQAIPERGYSGGGSAHSGPIVAGGGKRGPLEDSVFASSSSSSSTGWVSLPPAAAAQLLLSLHQLHALSPSSPAAQSIVLNAILDLFPQLRTNTWQALLSKARQTSLLSFITRSQHAQLRRHSKRPESLLEHPRQRARLEQRRLAAALREARLTEIQRRTLFALAEALSPTELITLLQLFASHLVALDQAEEEGDGKGMKTQSRGGLALAKTSVPMDYDSFHHGQQQEEHRRGSRPSSRRQDKKRKSAAFSSSSLTSSLVRHRTLMASLLLAETVLVSDVLVESPTPTHADPTSALARPRAEGASLHDLANLWLTLTVLRPLVLQERFGHSTADRSSTTTATFSSERQLLQILTGQVLHALQDHLAPSTVDSGEGVPPAIDLVVVMHKVSLGIKHWVEHAPPVDVAGGAGPPSALHPGRAATSLSHSSWLQQPIHREIQHVASLIKAMVISHKDFIHKEMERRGWSLESKQTFRNSILEGLSPLGLSDSVLERTLQECTF